MKTNMKKGFTLIELLVVIVIIGILASISVATFNGYFKKARDSERASTVSQMVTSFKTAGATANNQNYAIDNRNDAKDKLAKFGMGLPSTKQGQCYFYAHPTVTGTETTDEFVIFVGAEEEQGASGSGVYNFKGGTANAMALVPNAAPECTAPSITGYTVTSLSDAS